MTWKPAAWSAFLLGSMLFRTQHGRAEEGPGPEPPAPGQAQSAPPAGMPSDVEALRAELDRLRQEAEAARRAQEERIRALEQRLEALQQSPTPAVQLKPEAQPAPGTTPRDSGPEAKPAPPPPPPPGPVTVRPGFRARLYGFARADMDVDSRKMFAGPHLPFWVLSPDDPRAQDRDDGDFTLHPRLTRLGLDTEAPPVALLNDARLSGKLEVDFFNMLPDRNSGTSNSRQFLRIRQAYVALDWQHVHVLAGQTWDLISPLYPAANFDVVMWNAGNTGDRRPQFRVVWDPWFNKGRIIASVAAGSPSAVDSQDLDADQVVDVEESRRPTLQARVALNQPSWIEGQTWELGVWGHDAAYRIDQAAAIAGQREFGSHAFGIDLRLPVGRRLLVQGEGWRGKTLADIRGGVGQNVNVITGQEIHAQGGWAEALYAFTDWYTLGVGFTIDDPEDSEVTPFVVRAGETQNAALIRTGRTLNRSYYVVNRFPLGSGLLLGIDWMLFHTTFRGIAPGSNNRWNAWIQHNF